MSYEPIGMTESPASPSLWKWLLVAPAFVAGYFVPGFFARISWEFGTSLLPGFIPGLHVLMGELARLYQVLLDGFCAVFFAGYVAPRGRLVVSISGGLVVSAVGGGILIFTFAGDYYRNVSTVAVVWESLLVVLTIIGAGGAVWYSVAGRAGEEPVGLE